MNIYVRQDYKTVAEALQSAQDGDIIIIPSGIYYEKLTVDKKNIKLIGEGFVTLTYDAASGNISVTGEKYDTFSSPTVTITEEAAGFVAENITFENSYNRIDPDRKVTQAVAVSCGADAVFNNCNFLGCQDTLYVHGGSKQYFYDCYIEGSVDFIFGDATALFDECDINCIRSKSYITAASTPENTRAGLVFYNCYIGANPGCENIYLGRPWRAHTEGVRSHTAFIECTYNFDCAPEGWLPWHVEPGEETDNIRYEEYGNTNLHGDPVYVENRAPWSKQLSKDEAEALMGYMGNLVKLGDFDI